MYTPSGHRATLSASLHLQVEYSSFSCSIFGLHQPLRELLLLNAPLYSATYYKFVCQLFAAEQVVYSEVFVLFCFF